LDGGPEIKARFARATVEELGKKAHKGRLAHDQGIFVPWVLDNLDHFQTARFDVARDGGGINGQAGDGSVVLAPENVAVSHGHLAGPIWEQSYLLSQAK